MKKVKTGVWIGALGVALIGGLIWHFATHYAYKPIWVDLGPIPEARNNPYYAAQKFLEKKGYHVKTSGLLAEVSDRLDDSDTLFLFYDHELEFQTLNTDISDWVKRGGHLVVTVHYLWDEDNQSSGDAYLDALGVRQYLWPREQEKESIEDENNDESAGDETDSNETDKNETINDETPNDDITSDEDTIDEDTIDEDINEASDTETEALDDNENSQAPERPTTEENSEEEQEIEDVTPSPSPTVEKLVPLKNLNVPKNEDKETSTCGMVYAETVSLLPLSQGSHPLRIAFESEYHIEDVSGNAHAAFTEPPAHLLEYTLGAGKITVLTDYFIFNDSNIGDYDHAFFLWWLADTSPRVWLVYDKDSDTLIKLLWESAPYLCISILIALLGWLVFRGRRFGPILNVEHATRRQLQEHIDASTAFIWRAQERATLIDEARQPVLNKCPIVDNQITRTPRLLRTLEQLSISEERLLWALTTPSVEDEAEFVELIRLLQQLRMTL